MTYHLEPLMHLIAVTIAAQLAYTALDRFRYTNRIKGMLADAISCVIKENPKPDDKCITKLNLKYKDVTEKGLDGKLCIWFGPKVFGSANKRGWDSFLMFFIMGLLYIALSCCAYGLIDSGLNILFNAIFILCVIGTLLPIWLIIIGTVEVRNTKRFVLDTISSDAVEKKYGSSINDLKEKLNNNLTH